jgi:hypothetical protein
MSGAVQNRQMIYRVIHKELNTLKNLSSVHAVHYGPNYFVIIKSTWCVKDSALSICLMKAK